MNKIGLFGFWSMNGKKGNYFKDSPNMQSLDLRSVAFAFGNHCQLLPLVIFKST
jgi:hypothetical protein